MSLYAIYFRIPFVTHSEFLCLSFLNLTIFSGIRFILDSVIFCISRLKFMLGFALGFLTSRSSKYKYIISFVKSINALLLYTFILTYLGEDTFSGDIFRNMKYG